MRLIVGGDSAIGRNLSLYWTQNNTAHHSSSRAPGKISQYRPYLDLGKDIYLSNVAGYSSAVLCAGISHLKECRDNPEGTRKINIEGTLMLARYLAEHGTGVILISSDRVYDGTQPHPRPDDQVNPVTEYGRQKAEAENGILALPNCAVVRLTKVIYPGQPLLKEWITSLKAGRAITPFSDMWFAPVPMDSVVRLIDRIIKRGMGGIWHLSSTFEITYQNAASQISEILGANQNLIKPIPFLDNKKLTDVDAPRYTALDMEKTLDFGVPPIDPTETIHNTICSSEMGD